MARGYVALLLLLAAIWGASFMFIKIAVDELAPTTTMALRLGFSALPLLALVVVKLGLRPAAAQLRQITRAAIILGVVNTALPFTLIAWGETRIDSGVAAIGNASMPIFVVLLALRFRSSERATGSRLFGVVLGLAGVAVLAGVDPKGGWSGAVGTLAVVVASLSYAVGTLYTQGLLDEVRNDILAAASISWGAVLLGPLGGLQAPSHLPSWDAIGAVLALALLGTVAGQLIYFRLIYSYGSARASLVVYLLPVTALFYGALLLDEPITVAAIVGLALILTGTALGSGVLGLPRRREAVATAP
ncbi:MAG TPA: DMT family transporter [Gaiellaceae bacterium]|nr:DMT family transporter [Gaiellaceae bacterium]